MKTHLLMFLAFCITTVGFASDKQWRVLHSQDESLPVTINVRVESPSGMESAEYPILAVFIWKDSNPLKGGQKENDKLAQIKFWEDRLDEFLVSEQLGFHFATREAADELRSYFYVSEIEMLRYLSLKAGELLITTEVDYRFTSDPNWDEWKKMAKNSVGLATIPERPSVGFKDDPSTIQRHTLVYPKSLIPTP